MHVWATFLWREISEGALLPWVDVGGRETRSLSHFPSAANLDLGRLAWSLDSRKRDGSMKRSQK